MIDGADIAGLWPLWLVFGLLLIVGGVLSRRAYGAFRAHQNSPLLLLTAGLALITPGMPLTWTVAYFLLGNLLWCTIMSSAITLLGVLLMTISIQVKTG
jgi:hypothetical protein